MKKQDHVIDSPADNEEVISLKQQITALMQTVERLQQQLSKQSEELTDLTTRVTEASDASAAETSVSPDVLVIIAAAVSAFLGKKIRIRSAKMLQSPYEVVNPWSQQGRVSVQASHSLRWER